MAITHIQIRAAATPTEVAQNTEHAVNQAIQQINAQAGKLNQPLNAQQNAVTNLPSPQNDTDAVNLGYLNSILSTLTASINNTLNRRGGGGYRNLARPYHCIFKAALAQNGTGLPGFSFATSSSTGTGTSIAPTASVVSLSNGLYFGVLDFGTTGNCFVQDHFPLPEDWVPASLDCVVTWYAPDGGGDAATWQVAFTHTTNAASANQIFNGYASVAASVGSGPSIVISTITNVTITSNTANTQFQPGDEVWFKFGPTGVSGTAQLIDLKFLVRRSAG